MTSAILVLPSWGGPGARAQQAFNEHEIKVAFLYNFARLVEWPAAAFGTTSTFQLCVEGDDPFGTLLDDEVGGRPVSGRPVEIVRLRPRHDPRRCHLLFVGASETDRVAAILDRVRGASVLTVSDIEGFARLGGAIGLVTQGNKVRFEINAGRAGQVGLTISSALLALATIVPDDVCPRTK